ncbi:MAG TPA: AAA family ATPase [Acidimicrobiales bacterium]|nr:AAA family ATPase [Acidimicrobiales bacterium]
MSGQGQMRNPKILVLDRSGALAEQLERVLGDLRPRPEITTATRVGVVAEVLSADGPFDVLVAGPSLATRTGLARLEVIHDELPDMELLLAFGRRPDAALRDIVRTGAVDLVQLPADDEALKDSLNRILDMVRKKSAATAPAPVPGVANGTRDHLGKVFTMSSATGGCGKTFIATNLAFLLGHYTGKRACIIDLDLQFGEVSTALRLRPRFTISDALQREDADEADLEAHLEEYMVTHESGIAVLAAPKDPAEADRIDPLDVGRIITAARKRFDYVVVDTPSALNEIVLAAFDLSDTLFTMATLDLPSVRNMGVFLSALERLKIPSDNIKLLLNKAETDVGIDVAQITRLFPQGFTAVLPYSKEVSRSINLGVPVLASSPGAPISKLILQGFGTFLPAGDRPPAMATAAEPPADNGRRGRRLFRRQPAAQVH